jgi:peptidoglycan/xylan/chitin deacetylase (PgdA/CDA1 family)
MNMFAFLLFIGSFPEAVFGGISPLGSPPISVPVPVTDLMEKPLRPSESLAVSPPSTFFNRGLIAATFAKNREVLLTFDDGPHPEVTPLILDILARHQMKAVFFVVGVNVRKYPHLVDRIYREGHTIGNHTFYHINLRQHSQERVLKEIRTTNDLVEKITGKRPKVFRPPYGALNQTSLDLLRGEGMDVMLWTVDPGDWRNRNMAKTMENLKRQMRLNQEGKGGVVLFHDTQRSTAHALDPFLTSLSQHGLVARNFGESGTRSGTGTPVMARVAGKSFWGATQLSSLPWDAPFILDPDVFGRPLLSALLKKREPTKLTNIGLLRAEKTGNLMKVLLCRQF